MSFAVLNNLRQISLLPDGTLITWLPVMDDPSSEAVAFIRRASVDVNPGGKTPVSLANVWISPGNGWAPEPLSILVLPVRVVLLGEPRPGDYMPPEMFTPVEPDAASGLIEPTEWQTLDTGGTYPRDLALQCASAITAQTTTTSTTAEKCIEVTLMLADAFMDWLTPRAEAGPIPGLDARAASPRWYAQMDPISLPPQTDDGRITWSNDA